MINLHCTICYTVGNFQCFWVDTVKNQFLQTSETSVHDALRNNHQIAKEVLLPFDAYKRKNVLRTAAFRSHPCNACYARKSAFHLNFD